VAENQSISPVSGTGPQRYALSEVSDCLSSLWQGRNRDPEEDNNKDSWQSLRVQEMERLPSQYPQVVLLEQGSLEDPRNHG